MMNLRHVWFIALKNLRLFVTDRTALIMFILFPFLFIVMFNLLMNNATGGDNRLVLHLATQESEGLSVQIIQSLETPDPDSLLPGSPVIVWEKDYDQARAQVESKELSGLLAFPADFTQKVMSGVDTRIEILARADATSMRMALQGVADSLASVINAHRIETLTVVEVLTRMGSSEAEIGQAVALISARQMSAAADPALITTEVEKVGELQNFSASSFVVPGYLVMFVFFAAAIASVDVIQERRNHTLERLLASSVTRESILGGIFLGGVLRGLVQIAIFWTAGVLIFNVNLGVAPWAVFLLSFLMVLMSAAFSVMLATLVKTERSASALAVLCSLLMAPLGGCWWPLFVVPDWMQFLAKITPHGWANEGFNNLMLFGAKGGDVLWQMVALLAFAVAFMLIAVARFRTEAEAA